MRVLKRITTAICMAGAMTLLSPAAVLANAGTPLLWAVAFHLYIANIIIAIVESLLLWKFFRIKKYYISLLVMIVANFTSMISGFCLSIVYADLKHIPRYVMSYENTDEILLAKILLIISFFISVLVEFPFVYWLLKKRCSTLKIILANAAVNAISLMILIFIYWIFLQKI